MIPLKDDNPTNSKPIVSYGIIGFCVLIFLAQLGLSEEELRDFTYSPAQASKVFTAASASDLDGFLFFFIISKDSVLY